MKKVNIYIDVYHTGNLKKGTGTYSIVLEYMKSVQIPLTKQYIDGIKGTTKYRTEIHACIAALEHIIRPCDIEIVINSLHVTQAVNTTAWLQWIDTGKNAKGKPAKNMDLWRQLFKLVDKYQVILTYAESNQYSLYMKSVMKRKEIEYKEDTNNV